MPSSERGMSLVQLIMVIVLSGILASFFAYLIFYEMATYNFVTSHHETMHNSNRAIEFMSRDIRQIMAPDSIFHASADSFRFADVNDIMISYNFLNNQIQRNGDQLMLQVQAFQFNYYDNNGNQINVPITNPADIKSISLNLSTLIQGQQLTVQTRITPRNF